ncbi:MAG TPA: hypothetical protein VHC19_26330, partial [Pirellulales bacterium]|nr:hypothetical protein [Pirellulales bacterium]
IEVVRSSGNASHAAYSALFDPQTSGGLLLGIRPDQAEQFVSQLREASPCPAAIIGEVVPAELERPSLRLR